MQSVDTIEPLLRERLAGTLPGIEAQLRFASGLPRPGWEPGVYPSDVRTAAARGGPTEHPTELPTGQPTEQPTAQPMGAAAALQDPHDPGRAA